MLRALLDDQVAAVQAADGGLRTDVGAGIHRMRVELRRLRTTLVTFRFLLDDSVDPLASELQWFSASLGPARDIDVLRTRLAAAPPGEEVLGPFLAVAWRAALAEAEQAWGSERYAALLDGLRQLFASRLITGDGHVDAGAVLPRLVARELRRVRRRAGRLDEGTDPDQAMHRLRDATKRARSVSAVLQHLDGKPAAKLERALRRLQVLLGERRDSALARRYLEELLGSGELDRHGAAVVERLLAAETDEAAALDARVPGLVKKVTDRGQFLG